MSYCRFGEADVYVYKDVGGYLCCCCWCRLGGEGTYWSTQAMVDHLAEHRSAGHDVPDHDVPALWADDAENFPAQIADISGGGSDGA